MAKTPLSLTVTEYAARHLNDKERDERAFRQEGANEAYCYVEGRYVAIQRSGFPAVFIAPENKSKLIALLLMQEKRPPCAHNRVQGECQLCKEAAT